MAEEKLARSKRIPVIHDTTLFKTWEEERAVTPAGKPPKRFGQVELRRLVQLLVRARVTKDPDARVFGLERVDDRILQCLNVCTGHHKDQLYVAEFTAFKARELLFNIDLDLEARNTAVVQATKLQNCSFEEAAGLPDDAVKMEFEDVGGHVGDDDEAYIAQQAEQVAFVPDRIYP